MYCAKCAHRIVNPFSLLSEVDGIVNDIEKTNSKSYVITIVTDGGKEVCYHTLSNSKLAVKIGSVVAVGTPLTKGKRDIDKGILVSETYGEITDIKEIDDVYQITVHTKPTKTEYVVPNGIKPMVSELNVVKEGTLIAKEQSFTKKIKVYSPIAGDLSATTDENCIHLTIRSVDNVVTYYIPFSFRQTVNLHDDVVVGQMIAKNPQNRKDDIYSPFSGKVVSIDKTDGGYSLTVASYEEEKVCDLPHLSKLEKNVLAIMDKDGTIHVEKGQKLGTYEETYVCDEIKAELPGKVISILPNMNGDKIVTVETVEEVKIYETNINSKLVVNVGDIVHVGSELIEHIERERLGEDYHCPYCGHEVILHELDHDETREFNKALHNRFNVSREKVDNALVKVVLGSTLLIIGLLFFVLSFKLPNAAIPDKVLTITCFEFWVSMFGLVVGGVLLIMGVVSLIYEKTIVQKEINETLNDVQYGMYEHLDNNF
ncbi:MAG: hypothetical protein ACI31G_00355 [Bacilli bacterium]